MPGTLPQQIHPLAQLLRHLTRACVRIVASPCSSCTPSLPCSVVLHEPTFPFSLVPHLLDSTISTACLFGFLLLTSQPDHDFFPLQKLSFSLYNSPIDWWRSCANPVFPASPCASISNRLMGSGVRLRSTRIDAAAHSPLFLTLSIFAASILNSLGSPLCSLGPPGVGTI